MKRFKLNNLLAMVLLCIFLSAMMMAQVKTETNTTQGQPTTETKVERGEVIAVSGNDLVVKMEDGRVENFPDIPESARVTVDGQQLSIHDLKPGMKLERTITTTTTPQTVTTVKTVTGKVFQVMPPAAIILTLEDGSNEQFKIPEGQKFTVDGREVDAWGLRKGMTVSATKVVTAPETVVAEEKKVTGEMPPPQLPAQAIQGPLLIVIQQTPPKLAEATPPQTPSTPKEELPQSASDLPMITLISAGMILLGVVLFVWSRGH